ncbi:hypothetical protein [Bacillus sp. FJAT-52991]|uniref:Cytosolic protein n=1 Tax=Bacillus kandeliae TaxID=3129297 RepID=A0ABZ2N8U7_9BACI
MYVGRDLTELSMMSVKDWKENELIHFHQSFQPIVPYLNVEGQTIHKDIVEEIMHRGKLNTPRTEIPFDLGGS